MEGCTVVNIDRSLENRGLDAVKVVRAAAALVGGEAAAGRRWPVRAGGIPSACRRRSPSPSGRSWTRSRDAEGRPPPGRSALPPCWRPSPTRARAPAVEHACRRHRDPRGGFNGDIWVHETTVYLGSWGITGRCPAFGVRAISVARRRGRASSPACPLPRQLGRGRVGGRGHDADLHGRPRRGRAPARPERDRRARALRRLEPARPQLLSTLPSGAGTRGVHELSIVQRADGRVLALLAVPQSPSRRRARRGRPDRRHHEPRAPLELADRDYRRDGPNGERQALTAIRGASEVLVHSVWPYAGG